MTNKRNPLPRARVECPSCEKKVTISPQSDWRCPSCTLAFCPFCMVSLFDGCEHVLGSYTDGGWNYRPFDELQLPEVPQEFEGAEPTAEEWGRCFGEFATVVQESYALYGTLECSPELEDEPTLFEALLVGAGVNTDTSSWHVDSFGYTSSAGSDWFVKDRANVMKSLQTQIARLHDGFEQLYAALRCRGAIEGGS